MDVQVDPNLFYFIDDRYLFKWTSSSIRLEETLIVSIYKSGPCLLKQILSNLESFCNEVRFS